MGKFKIAILLIILASIPLTVFLGQKVQTYLNFAAEPTRKMALGISLPYGRASKDINTDAAIAEIEKFASPVSSGGVGAYPATYSIWTDFEEGSWNYGSRSKFPNQKFLNYLDSKHITPVIFMTPVGGSMTKKYSTLSQAQRFSNQSIANGSFDAYLIEWANSAKAYGKPIIFRYAWEMNGTWFPWSPYSSTIGQNYYDVGNTPENYIAAWKHIYDLIKPIAPNVKFFWCPGGTEGGVTHIKRFYPGNNYVDYVGFDSYNWSPARTTNNPSLSAVYSTPIGNIREIVTGSRSTLSPKPILIGETGVLVNNTLRSDKLDFNNVYSTYLDLKGIIYFDVDVNYLFGANAEPGINWRLSGKSDNPAITTQGVDLRSKYNSFVTQEKFMGHLNPNYELAALNTPILTPTKSFTPTPTKTPPTTTPTKSNTPTPTKTPSPTPTKTFTPTPTKAPTKAPTSTPTKSNTPTPTKAPSPTPTKIFTPTPTPVVTATPLETVLKFSIVKLHGIGTGGDNTNPNIGGNNNPITQTRVLTVELYNDSGALTKTVQGNIVYGASNGYFSGSIILDSGVAEGRYLIKIKTDKYLRRQLSKIITVTKGTVIDMPEATLVTGDSNGDGTLSILDYNVILDCYSDFVAPKNCSDPAKKTKADLSDDGLVNHDDHTLFLRELSVVSGD